MSNQNIKCSKCNIAYDQNLGSSYSMEVGKQRRIFTKNGKSFCFNCLASEYNVNCQYCHKRINSKDELANWGGGVISINGDYDYCKADDWVFTCLGCDEKIRELWKNGVKPSMCSGWGPILFPENRKCRIAGCSQKPYYECVDLCLSHSKPCKGGKIKPNGKKCNKAMGSDEGDICEFCKNQTETQQQRKSREAESNQSFEQYQQAQEKAQSHWNSLSSSERERECERLVENMKAGKYWANNINEGSGSGWACDGSFWEIKKGKFTSSSPHLVPIQIVEEFLEREFGKDLALALKDCQTIKRNSGDDGDNSSPGNNSPTPNFAPNPSSPNQSDYPANPGMPREPSPPITINQVKNIQLEIDDRKEISASSPPTNPSTLIINLREIKQISLSSDDNLVIEFNNTEPRSNYNPSQFITADQVKNSPELTKIKDYLQKEAKNSLNQSELTNLFQTSFATAAKTPNYQALWISCGISGALIIGVVIGLLVKKNRGKKTN